MSQRVFQSRDLLSCIFSYAANGDSFSALASVSRVFNRLLSNRSHRRLWKMALMEWTHEQKLCHQPELDEKRVEYACSTDLWQEWLDSDSTKHPLKFIAEFIHFRVSNLVCKFKENPRW